MNEYYIGWVFTGSLLGLVIASTLYWLGGRNDKIIRRLGSALTLALTVNIASLCMGRWNPYLLIIFPLLFGGFSLGYGADLFWQKVIRRTIYALGVTFSGIIFCLTVSPNCFWILIPHIGIGLFSVYMGVKNPIHAVAEEGMICVALNLGLILYPFIV